MDKILIYLLIKHKFIWDKVFCALKNKESVDTDQANKICESIKCDYITIINDMYPYYLRTVYKPPFAIFYSGNFELMNKKHICIESRIDNQNLKCLKFLAVNDYVLCFRKTNLNKSELDLLVKSHLPFIIYVDNIKEIMNNNKLMKLIKNKQMCFVSELYGSNQKITPRFFYGSDNEVIFFNNLKSENDEAKTYLINKKNKVYLCTNKTYEFDLKLKSKLTLIKNFNDFKVVFISKN